jgi:hypothetical protein
MKKLLIVVSVFGLGVVADRMLDGVLRNAEAVEGQAGGAEKCAAKNGDVNASGAVDLADAVTILGNLFLGNPAELLPLCASSAARGLPDTGQARCFTCEGVSRCDVLLPPNSPLFGQDSRVNTGCPNDASRFTDNGDGTVTDNCTGLMWQKRTADVNSDGQSTGADSIPWCNAMIFCSNLGLGGHNDWRLPNVRELESIVDYGRSGPAIDPVFSATSGRYWSSTSIESNPESAWLVEFFGGGPATCAETPTPINNGCCDKSCEALVRAVRGGQ